MVKLPEEGVEGDDGCTAAVSEDCCEGEDWQEPGHQSQPGQEGSPIQQVLPGPGDEEVLRTDLAHHEEGGEHGPSVPWRTKSQPWAA